MPNVAQRWRLGDNTPIRQCLDLFANQRLADGRAEDGRDQGQGAPGVMLQAQPTADARLVADRQKSG